MGRARPKSKMVKGAFTGSVKEIIQVWKGSASAENLEREILTGLFPVDRSASSSSICLVNDRPPNIITVRGTRPTTYKYHFVEASKSMLGTFASRTLVRAVVVKRKPHPPAVRNTDLTSVLASFNFWITRRRHSDGDNSRIGSPGVARRKIRSSLGGGLAFGAGVVAGGDWAVVWPTTFTYVGGGEVGLGAREEEGAESARPESGLGAFPFPLATVFHGSSVFLACKAAGAPLGVGAGASAGKEDGPEGSVNRSMVAITAARQVDCHFLS